MTCTTENPAFAGFFFLEQFSLLAELGTKLPCDLRPGAFASVLQCRARPDGSADLRKPQRNLYLLEVAAYFVKVQAFAETAVFRKGPI